MESLLFREAETENLEKEVRRTLFLGDRLTIIGVSGKAGVGKSLLTNHVLSQAVQRDPSIFKLSVNGSSALQRDDFFALIDKLTQVQVAGNNSPTDAFGRTRRLIKKHAAFATAVADEMDRKKFDQKVKDAIRAVIKAGSYANRILPFTQKYLKVKALEQDKKATQTTPEEALAALTSFSTREWRYLPMTIQNIFGITFENDLRRDPYGLAARAMLEDLRQLVQDPELCDPEKAYKTVRRFKRAVIVVDDFETLGPCLSDFLFSSLLPRAKDESFGTVLVVVGRDDLSQSLSPGVYNQYASNIKAEVSLEPFNRQQALSFLEQNGITGEQAEDIFDWSRGNPYLLSLRRKDKHNLNSARMYYKRSTQWLSVQELEWFDKLVYLDPVNKDTLGWLFPQELTSNIQKWFENQYDLRDVNADEFRVEPILRNQALYYFSKHSPKEHDQILNTIASKVGDGMQDKTA